MEFYRLSLKPLRHTLQPLKRIPASSKLHPESSEAGEALTLLRQKCLLSLVKMKNTGT